jgi:aspartokinase
MKVYKFGGASVQDAKAIMNAASIKNVKMSKY